MPEVPLRSKCSLLKLEGDNSYFPNLQLRFPVLRVSGPQPSLAVGWCGVRGGGTVRTAGVLFPEEGSRGWAMTPHPALLPGGRGDEAGG